MGGYRDLFNPNVMRDEMHRCVVANEQMAKVLAAKGYWHSSSSRNAATAIGRRSCDLPAALEWL